MIARMMPGQPALSDAERALLADLIADAAGLAEAVAGEEMDAFERDVERERAREAAEGDGMG